MVIKNNEGLWAYATDTTANYDYGAIVQYRNRNGNTIDLGNGYIFKNAGGMGMVNQDGGINWFQVDNTTGQFTINGNEVT
jgi:hypothetical protein